MTPNEGILDRVLRTSVGLALVGLAATHWIEPWGWIGIVPIATGLAGWCPLYRVLGLRTCTASR
jgi:hypothetical protein